MSSSMSNQDLYEALIEEDEFDPFEDNQPDEYDDAYDEIVDFIGAPESAILASASAEVVDERSAKERLADLFVAMAPRRRVLLGILGFCTESQPVISVNEEVDRLQENDFSVYTAANYCELLEKAGAIRRVTADGDDFSQIKVEPKLVEEDGIEYYEPGTPPEAFWVDTEEGLAYLEADKPLDRFRELLGKDSAYLPVYKRILTFCAREGGATAQSLGIQVDSDPLVQKPRLYAPRFIDRLEKCDVLVWRGSWVITDIGLKGLELLSDVVDDYISEESVQPEEPAQLTESTTTA